MPILKTSLKKGGLKEHKLVKLNVNDKSLVLTNTNSKLYAMDAVCSLFPLEEGTVEEYTLIFHGNQGKFDIRTAKASVETDRVADLK